MYYYSINLMNTDYRYRLETPRVTGRRQQKTACPACGRPRCFVRYVDTHADCSYVGGDVGKCDHQHSCGYHYKPSEYFRDNQWARLAPQRPGKRYVPPPPPPFQPIPQEYVLRSHSPRSVFWQWFSTDAASRLGLAREALQEVYEDYALGATRRGCVIFWQTDERQRVHGGHVMQYRADGHREGYQGWTHVALIKQGLLPPGWQLRQCLFGQHLLPKYPRRHVCIVESEKTALVMAACQPEHLWLATCGSGGLNAEKLECLRGRRFTLFPDSGCLEKWQAAMQRTSGLQYTVSDRMEQYPANTDLADLLLHPP